MSPLHLTRPLLVALRPQEREWVVRQAELRSCSMAAVVRGLVAQARRATPGLDGVELLPHSVAKPDACEQGT